LAQASNLGLFACAFARSLLSYLLSATMAPMKRPAAAAAAPAAKRHSAYNKQCDMIIDALMAAPELPEHTKQMLCAGLSHCLNIPKDERHGYQASIIEWTQATLESVKAAAAASLQEAENKVAAASGEKEGRDAALKTCEDANAQKIEAVTAKETALSNANAALKAAKKALSTAEHEQTRGDKDLAEAESDKEKLQYAKDGPFTKMKTDALEGGDLSLFCTVAKKLGGDIGMDSSMAHTLNKVFSSKPEERGSFDKLLAGELDAELDKQIGALVNTMKTGEQAKQQRAAQVQAAKAALEAAEAADSQAKEGLHTAKTEHDESVTALKEAKKNVQSYGSDMKDVHADFAHEQKAAAALEKGALAAFAELKEYDGKPKEVEVPPAEEAVDAAPADAPADAAAPAAAEVA